MLASSRSPSSSPNHFRENVDPLDYKAFLVAVDRETCAKYKVALDRHLPPDWSEVVYTSNASDPVDRPLVAELQLSEAREQDVRKSFKKPAEQPKILIVTDKLLTGYDAPVLYAMYLDKPMRDHVLLQAIARVNRPYVDAEGVQKRVGLDRRFRRRPARAAEGPAIRLGRNRRGDRGPGDDDGRPPCPDRRCRGAVPSGRR